VKTASARHKGAAVHPTAWIEEGAVIGRGTSIWDHVHIRSGAVLGKECIVGEKSYIACDVKIGNRVKINAFVYICAGVEIEDGVMMGAGVIFTNDRYPRATSGDLKSLRPSGPDMHTEKTMVRCGATIGAGAIVGCGLEIGRFAMVGMGSVVTKPVSPFCLVFGQPASPRGFVCRCGRPVLKFERVPPQDTLEIVCAVCNRKYHLKKGCLIEGNTP